ncbi:MAG: thiamine-phosphate kinase [Bacteroidales bacterium]|nr:thiamine-phosphate kinase [Bacteroidales bacterium]
MQEKKDDKTKGAGKFMLAEKLMKKYGAGRPEDTGCISSTALLLEGIHFSLVYFPLSHLGYKAAICAIAGVYSDGGTPEQLTVSLGIGTRHKIDDIEMITEGISLACKNHSLKINGISLETSLTGLTIAVTATGRPGSFADRAAAPSGTDLLCVTGNLGGAWAGLHVLERERKVYEESGGAQPQLERYSYIIEKQLKPEFPAALITSLADQGITPTSMTVTSEGLASDAITLCRKAGVGCIVYVDRLPVAAETKDAAAEMNLEPVIGALNGGDDFELLFTIPVTQHSLIENMEGVTVIGHITPSGDGCNLSLSDGSLTRLMAPGWEGK